jgi:hypothetical protein
MALESYFERFKENLKTMKELKISTPSPAKRCASSQISTEFFFESFIIS